VKRAINQWGLPADMAVRTAIETCARLGYEGLELNLGEEGELGLDTSSSKLQEITSWARDAGVALHSVCSGLGWRYPVSSRDRTTRAKGMAVARKQLEIATAFGADAILLVPGVVTGEDPYEEVHERALVALKELAEEAARAQVHIGVENVGNNMLLSPLEMRQFIDSVGSPWVGAYYDVGNTIYMHQGWPEQWIRILGQRIRKIHLKDHNTAAPTVDVPLLAGDAINWPEVMAALREVGYDGFLTAEFVPYRHYPLKLAQDALASLSILVSGSRGQQ